jgi:hypothetical protein
VALATRSLFAELLVPRRSSLYGNPSSNCCSAMVAVGCGRDEIEAVLRARTTTTVRADAR